MNRNSISTATVVLLGIFSRMQKLSEAGIIQCLSEKWKLKSPCKVAAEEKENKHDGNSKVYVMVFLLATGICFALLTLMVEVCVNRRSRSGSSM